MMFNVTTPIELISSTEWLRIVILYSHLGLCIFSISSILKTDVALIFDDVTHEELTKTANSIAVLLLFLWATGLAIIYIDTGFQPSVLMSKPKLLFKLMCVYTLTFNGLLLHHISFPALTNNAHHMNTRESILLVIIGAVSTSQWLLVVFIGMSKPLGRLPFVTIFSAYSLLVLTVITISLFFIPHLLKIRPMFLSEAT